MKMDIRFVILTASLCIQKLNCASWLSVCAMNNAILLWVNWILNTLVNCNAAKFLYLFQYETKRNKMKLKMKMKMVGHEIWRRNAVIKKFELNFCCVQRLIFGSTIRSQELHVWAKEWITFYFSISNNENILRSAQLVVSISLSLSASLFFFFFEEIHFGSSSPTILFFFFLLSVEKRNFFVTQIKSHRIEIDWPVIRGPSLSIAHQKQINNHFKRMQQATVITDLFGGG